jgi:hypothetical protein
MLLGLYSKPRMPLDDVCHAVGIPKGTAYNQRCSGTFPIPMNGYPLTADVRDVAEYLDKLRADSVKP